MTALENLSLVRSAACPLVFATGNEEAPFSIHGSGFLVAHGTGVFFVAAAHSVGKADPQRLVIYPGGKAPTLRTRRWWRVKEDPSDFDSTDLILLEIHPRSVTDSVRSAAAAADLSAANEAAWRAERWESLYFTFGYPAAANNADYELSNLMIAQVLLHGSYSRPWSNGCCHEMRLSNPLGLKSFDGFSGSPVFSCASSIAIPQPVRFVGMCLRGTVSSGRVHFLASDVLRSALTEALA